MDEQKTGATINLIVQQTPTGAHHSSIQESPKLRLMALLLSLFLGAFGAHRFYVGKIGSAIVMLLISITVIGLLITGIWNLIDFIMICSGTFRDVENRPLLQWTA